MNKTKLKKVSKVLKTGELPPEIKIILDKQTVIDATKEVISELANRSDNNSKELAGKLDKLATYLEKAKNDKRLNKVIDAIKGNKIEKVDVGNLDIVLSKLNTIFANKPNWYKQFVFPAEEFFKDLVEVIDAYWKKIWQVEIKNQEPIKVYVVDAKGNIINRFGSIQNMMGSPGPASSGGGGADPVGIKNAAGVQINPATDEGLDDIIALLTTIEANQLPDNHNVTIYGSAKGTTVAASPTVSAAGANINGIDVILRDLTGAELDFRQENENWNAADHGILFFGRDTESVPDKYRAIVLDADGRVITHLANSAHEQFDFKTLDYDTGGATDNISAIGIALPASGGAVAGGTATNPIRIDPTGTTIQPISGTVTSELSATDNAVLDAIAASLAILDDWDESDRAKVNIIAGQAGITAGAGAVAANTPRITHASDDPAITALQIMDDWDDADRAKISMRLIKSTITDTTVDSTADLIFDASADTDAVELTITNVHTTALYVGEDASVTTSDFMYYIPPKQTIVIWHAGNSGTTEDLYGIRDAGNSGACKVYSRKYKT